MLEMSEARVQRIRRSERLAEFAVTGIVASLLAWASMLF
jgi:hypothetical protein